MEVKAKGKHVNAIHAGVLQAVHFSNWEGNDLGVAFAKYNETNPDDFGDVVRVFGSSDELYEFYLKLVEVVDLANIEVSEPAETPETKLYVSFIRDRQCTRNSPSNLRRRIQRAIEQGKEYTPKTIDYPIHRLSMPSVSTGKAYNFYIRKVDTPTEGGGQYGLGKLVPSF
jgi:CRISPR-associated endoribonuclease Cas6/Csy4 subtype I-F